MTRVFSRGFKDRFTVAAEAYRAVDKETSPLGSEEMASFLVAARGDGRASAPKGAAITTAP